MKKLLILVVFILLQSCMTYKGVNFEDIDTNIKNRLSINVKDKSDIVNGLLISKEQNRVTIETKKKVNNKPFQKMKL